MRLNNWLHFLSVACTCLGLVRAAAAQVPARQPVVKIIDRGAEPRRELRYHFKKGAVETVDLEMKIEMKMNMGGQAVPAGQQPGAKIGMQVKTLDVADNGDGKLSMEIVSADVIPDPAADPQAVAAMQQQLQQTVGLKAEWTVTPRGETKDAQFQAPNGNPNMAPALKGMQQQLGQMSAPLPKESVGVGAKWEIGMNLNANNINLDQTVIYTLKELDKDSAAFDVALTQKAQPQQIQGVQLQKMQSVGTGSGKFDLSRLIPIEMKMKMETKMVVATGNAAANGASDKIEMEMTTDMSMKPGQPIPLP